jgi:MFS family permease
VRELDDVALGGLLVAASLAPAVLAAPLAGVALDRARHPRRFIVASAIATVVGYAAVSMLGILPVPLILLLLVVAGLAAPFYYGGLSSFVTDEVPDERRAYAYDALSYNLSSVAGPGVVALATAAGPPRLAMWIVAGAALIAVFSPLALTMHARPATSAGVLQTISAGVRHLVAHRPLAVVTSSGTLNAVGGGALPIAAVALAIERTGSAGDAAIIVTAFAVGGLVGGLAAAIRPSTRFAPQFVMGVTAAAVGVFTLAAIPDLGIGWTVAAIGTSGLFTASGNAGMLLLRKQQSPPQVRSQVFTIGSGLRATASAAGAVVAGTIAGLPAGTLVAGIGLIWLCSAALMLLYPRGAVPLDETATLDETAALD